MIKTCPRDNRRCRRHGCRQLDLLEPCPVQLFHFYAQIGAKSDRHVRPIATRKPAAYEVPVYNGSPEAIRARKQIAELVIASGGGVSELARRCGITPTSASHWLANHDPDLHARLKEQPHPVTTDRYRRIARYKAVYYGRMIGCRPPEIARAMDLTTDRLLSWLRMWAPDGVKDALSLELDEDQDTIERVWA